MSRRIPPISWRLRSRPSLWYPDASATRTEPVFHGSMYSSTRQDGDGPREGGQRHQGAARGAAASMLSGHRVARRRAARRQVLKPQPNPAHGVIGFCIGDGERQANSLGESSSLPLDPLQSLLRCGKRGQTMLDTEPTQRAVEVLSLGHRHVGVVRSVHDQHRGTDRRGVGDRAELVVPMCYPRARSRTHPTRRSRPACPSR
jgi:hypothetical protein